MANSGLYSCLSKGVKPIDIIFAKGKITRDDKCVILVMNLIMLVLCWNKMSEA
jgi:hypothetical protein